MEKIKRVGWISLIGIFILYNVALAAAVQRLREKIEIGSSSVYIRNTGTEMEFTDTVAGSVTLNSLTGGGSFNGDLTTNPLKSTTNNVTIRTGTASRTMLLALEDPTSSTDDTDLEAWVGVDGVFHGNDITHSPTYYTFTAKDPVNETTTSGSTKGRPSIGMAWGDATLPDFIKLNLRDTPRLQIFDNGVKLDDALQMTGSDDTAPQIIFADSGTLNGGMFCQVVNNLTNGSTANVVDKGGASTNRLNGFFMVSVTNQSSNDGANGLFSASEGSISLVSGNKVSATASTASSLNLYPGTLNIEIENNLGNTKTVIIYFFGHWGFTHQ